MLSMIETLVTRASFSPLCLGGGLPPPPADSLSELEMSRDQPRPPAPGRITRVALKGEEEGGKRWKQ